MRFRTYSTWETQQLKNPLNNYVVPFSTKNFFYYVCPIAPFCDPNHSENSESVCRVDQHLAENVANSQVLDLLLSFL